MINRTTTRTLLTLSVAALSAPLVHSASLVALVDVGAGAYSLGSFDSANPGVATFSPVTGLGAGEVLTGLDYRPATGTLYAIGTGTDVYTINATTGAATDIGGYANPVPGSNFGFDFNPAFMSGTFARIISDLDDNRVISGVDGSYLGADKTDVFYLGGDLNAGANPNINHIAYTNSVLGATSTQQYGIDTDLDILVTVANNAGTLETVGMLGIDASSLGGFDIAGASGQAFGGFQNGGGTSSIYAIDLSTGAATSTGNFAGNIVGLTAVPEPSTGLLFGLAALAAVTRRKR